MNALIYTIAFVLACPAFVRAEQERVNAVAPSELPHTSRLMQTPGFWAGRHPSPDAVIMTSPQIAAFNAHIQNDLQLTKDIFAVTEQFKTESLMDVFNKTLADFKDKGYCTAAGVRNDDAFLEKVKRNMNLSGVVLGVAPRYGLVVHYADVRFFPLSEGLYESPGDVDFDQLQNSSLDVGTPVAVIHQSLDKKWYYVLSPTSDGWVQADRVALGEMKAVKEFAQPKDFVVAVKARADIFLDEPRTVFHDYLRMGARLPLTGSSAEGYKVFVPVLDKEGKLQIVPGYVERGDAHEGYLPYTARTIYHQAFAMLNEPYGWGGMYGRQDCSAFLDEVFATVGIFLPRDSKDEARVAEPASVFEEKSTDAERMEALKNVQAPGVLLPMKGHIMLYLGMADGRPYAIHDIWAYREPKDRRDVPRVLNRVVVSDLSLGEGSHKGSLLKRLSRIVEVK